MHIDVKNYDRDVVFLAVLIKRVHARIVYCHGVEEVLIGFLGDETVTQIKLQAGCTTTYKVLEFLKLIVVQRIDRNPGFETPRIFVDDFEQFFVIVRTP